MAAYVGLLLLLWELEDWILGAAGVLVAAVPMYAVYRLGVLAYRRRFRFSLRELLIAIAVLSLLLGAVVRPMVEVWWRHGAFRGVIDAGGSLNYGREGRENSKNLAKRGWAESRLGYDPSAHIAGVNLPTDSALASMAERIEHFSEVESLTLSARVTDAGLARAERLAQLPRLRNVNLLCMPVTDAGLESVSKWSQSESSGCVRHC